VEPQV